MTDQEKLQGVKEGLQIIEAALAKARKADPLDVPMPLVGDEARIWHAATANAYQHALEMLNASSWFGIEPQS